MQHKALLGFTFEDLQTLHIFAGSECSSDKRLGFAAREDCRAMGSWEHADFNRDWANLIEGPAIGTALMTDHLLAENALAQNLIIVLKLVAGFFVLFRQFGLQLLPELLHQSVALGLDMFLGVQPLGQIGTDLLL